MPTSRAYDAIVIGTGQAGKPLAHSLAASGRRTAIIEREEKVGGSCIVHGCTPTKTMVASGRVAYLARRAWDYGVATGRAPNTDRLHLEAAGVELHRGGYIRVNERLETNVGGIYALGDVKGGPAFTHISYDDYRIVEANLLNGANATIKNRLVPYCVFTDPELGRVGLSEREARERGLPFKVARLPMSRAARAIESGETRGFMKAIVDSETEQILGAAILGVGGGEVMSVVEVAMLGKLPYTALRDGIFAHPTLSESLNNLFWNLED